MIDVANVEESITRLAQMGPRRWHPPGTGHAAAIGGCDHRTHQGELPRPHFVPRGSAIEK
jgi:hypothetical protein